MPDICDVFTLDASKVNEKGGKGVVTLANDILNYLRRQSPGHGECRLVVYKGNPKENKVQKKGKNKREDLSIEKAIERLLKVLKEIIGKDRLYEEGEKIFTLQQYNSIYVKNGIEPEDEDIHCYYVHWYCELGCFMERRLLRESVTSLN